MSKATPKQVDFLRDLGYAQGARLTKQQAAETIGRLLAKKREKEQKGWLKELRANNRAMIRDDARSQKDLGDEFVGYIIHVGSSCHHAKHLNGSFVSIKDAQSNFDLLPPYDECQESTCECGFKSVGKDEIPSGTRIVIVLTVAIIGAVVAILAYFAMGK